MKVKGFTLAETLIILGIIGIISTLTLPAIITNTKEKQTIIKVKKAYSVLQNSSLKMRSELGDLNEWSDDSRDFFMQELSKNLQVTKTCNMAAKCSMGFAYTYPAIGLNDGTLIAIVSRNPNNGTGHVCQYSVNNLNSIALHYGSCASVLVDINGNKKPNKKGEDIFEFRFFKDGVIPNGINSTTGVNVESENFDNCLINKGNHGACTAWVVINENMDYLHCPEKIGWNKAKSCKDK